MKWFTRLPGMIVINGRDRGLTRVSRRSMRSILRNHRFRRDARTLEDEEEMWFNTDEDDLEDGEAVVPPSDKMKTEEDLMEPISKFMERKKCE